MTEIEVRWNALSPAPDKPVFQLLDAQHPLKLYLGREITGEYLFLVVDPDQPPKFKNLRSVRINAVPRSDGQWSLILRLEQQELAGVFALLCNDLAESSRHLKRDSSGMKVVSRRLASWRRLMESGESGILSADEVRGLFGELLLLDRFLIERLGPDAAVNCWVGPLGSDQDFQLANEAWEVKATHSDSSAVHISSESQLDSESRQIFLVVMTLNDQSENKCESLNELVLRIKGKLVDHPVAVDLFDDRLVRAKYIVRNEYESPKFKADLAMTFEVKDGFPRIRRGDLKAGVEQVKYVLKLDTCKSFLIPTPFELD